MSTRIRITHMGGDNALSVTDINGNKVALLEKEGDEFGDTVSVERSFCVEEVPLANERAAG